MTINRLLNSEDIAWLTDSQQWRFITAGSNDTAAPDSEDHRKWMAQHSHSHPYPELLFVLEGESLVGLADQIHPLQPASVCYFDTMDRHDYGYRTGGPLRHLWVTILDNNYLAQLVERRGRHKYRQIWREVLSPDLAGVLPGAFLSRKENKTGPQSPVDVIKSAAMVLVNGLIRCGYGPAANSLEDLHREVVAATCQHIQKTAGNGISLSTLARIAGYSKFHFLRIFRQQSGLTVQQYIDRCRSARFQELLADGNSQKNIAKALGFSHPAALSRWKKKIAANKTDKIHSSRDGQPISSYKNTGAIQD